MSVTVSTVQIDEQRLDTVCHQYFKWKDLNTYVKQESTRGINMPDVISEPMACYCLGYLWNRGDVAGDATDPHTGQKIEFKATSNWDGDLSSFGPSSTFDNLVFLRFNIEENLLYIYDLHINSDELGTYPANKKQTIHEQRLQKRRPHVSLYNLFVKTDAGERTPDIIFNIRTMRVLEDNRLIL